MLEKSTSVLLISDVRAFSDRYKALSDSVSISMTVECEWDTNYRVSEDTVILGSKHLAKLNRAYYPKAVLILKKDESPFQYIEQGIKRFIFNYQNDNELLFALFKSEVKILHSSSVDLKTILKDSCTVNYCFGDYDFKFDQNTFKYKGKPIYLATSQKEYLADWLLNGHKDNKKRMVICNLRKKFGSDFLKDVDRFGQWRLK